MCSPHILDQRERISLSGRPISAVAWSALVDTHLPTLQQCHEESGGRLTWFEAMTGLAYKYFQKKACSLAQQPPEFLARLLDLAGCTTSCRLMRVSVHPQRQQSAS